MVCIAQGLASKVRLVAHEVEEKELVDNEGDVCRSRRFLASACHLPEGSCPNLCLSLSLPLSLLLQSCHGLQHRTGAPNEVRMGGVEPSHLYLDDVADHRTCLAFAFL